jgi:hypothetical protein
LPASPRPAALSQQLAEHPGDNENRRNDEHQLAQDHIVFLE